VVVTALDVGVQLVKFNVTVDAAEKPCAPSNVAAVLAGDALKFPDPVQVPEIVKLFDSPFATSVL
jgi:acyl dehydratase